MMLSNKTMSKHFKKPRYHYYQHYKEMKVTIEKRYNVLIAIISVLILALFSNLFYLQVIKAEDSKLKLEKLQKTIVYGPTAPRGRIYDRNHNLLVDNVPNKTIVYKKQKGITTSRELELSYELADLIEVPYTKLTDEMKRVFYLKNHESELKSRITEEEWQALEERRLRASDIESKKKERITEEELASLTERDLEASYIYALMNKGYSYTEKIIKQENVSDFEYAVISEREAELSGVMTQISWERSYPYGNLFRTILGSVSTNESGIPLELKDHYLKEGYELTDRVGTSYLEYQYDSYLKGLKDQYEVYQTGEKVLVKEGTRGNDLVLTIDIELQKRVEEILEQELVKTKQEPNTKFYNRSFVVIADPKTGEILAMAGKQIIEKSGSYEFVDFTPGITTSPVVVGSAVKGASHIVGYNSGVLTIGEKRYDSCIKLAGAPEKCSWKNLGWVDDIRALRLSSNIYQFYTAMKVAGYQYSYNMPFKASHEAFELYRSTFAQFGLGVKTGIDLPIESLGYHGTSEVGGLLLDFAIGQYDTYTPIQLSQYIGTIANNGTRLQPVLLKAVYSSLEEPFTSSLFEQQPIVLNQVDTKPEYLERVKLGFQEVMKYGGTGSRFIDLRYRPAGKTGTSQSFVDSDHDGKIDTETISNTFVAYAPYEDPKVTFTVVSPDIYYSLTDSSYESTVNKRISALVSQAYFERYPVD